MLLAAEAVRAGDLIAFPTDTVYGVGGDLSQPAAIGALFALKGRDAEKALPILLASAAQLSQVAREVPESAWRLIHAFWPGALTIVLARHPDVPAAVGPAAPTIGVRVPAHRDLLRLLETVGRPLASSSANPAGQPPARDAGAVDAALGGGLRLILDGGTLPPAPASTVVDLTGETPLILRRGPISAAEIGRVLHHTPLVRPEV
ncbi:MAG: hypothetical protein NVSMB65_11660 [Chloroflexota bacterium]